MLLDTLFDDVICLRRTSAGKKLLIRHVRLCNDRACRLCIHLRHSIYVEKQRAVASIATPLEWSMQELKSAVTDSSPPSHATPFKPALRTGRVALSRTEPNVPRKGSSTELSSKPLLPLRAEDHAARLGLPRISGEAGNAASYTPPSLHPRFTSLRIPGFYWII